MVNIFKTKQSTTQPAVTPERLTPAKPSVPEAPKQPVAPRDAFAAQDATGAPSGHVSGAEPALQSPKVPSKAAAASAGAPPVLSEASARHLQGGAVSYPPKLQRLSTSYGQKPGTSLSQDLQSADPKARLKGLKNLEKAPGNWDPYISMVIDDHEPTVVKELLRVALKYETQVSPELLGRVITRELSPDAPADRRFLTLGLLCFVKTVDVGPHLKRYASDPDERFRRSVAQTVAYRFDDISKEDANAVISAQLRSENPDHRMQMMNLLAKKSSMPLSPYLAMCAGDANPKLRKVMYQMLADGNRLLTLSRADTTTIFQAELKAPDAKRRLAAIAAMQTIPRFDARPLLQACIADAGSTDQVKQAAQKALGGLR